MPRDIYGNSLPPVEDSRDSDIFHNIITNKNFVFDNGEWNELPQEVPTPAPTIPTPAIADAGKVIKVSNTGEYELGEAGGGSEIEVTIIEYQGNDWPQKVSSTDISLSSTLYMNNSMGGVSMKYRLLTTSIGTMNDIPLSEHTMYYIDDDGNQVFLPAGAINMILISGLLYWNNGTFTTYAGLPMLYIDATTGNFLYEASN